MVISTNWGYFAGAVTWGSGTTGVSGPVLADNSFLGTARFGGWSMVFAYVFTLLAIGPRLTLRSRDGSGGYFIRCQGFPGWSSWLQRGLGVTGPWDRPGSAQTAPASGLVEFRVPFIPFRGPR